MTINAERCRAIAFSRYGGPDVLTDVDRPVPRPGAGELVVRVAAAALNPGDVWVREGRFRRFLKITMPFVPGYDVAGVVESVGAGARAFGVGDRVIAMQPLAVGGGYSTHTLVKAAHASLAPEGPFVAAAALPLVGLTALQGLRDRARLASGQRLLVYGAAGGVGHLAVQVGGILGARITAVASARHTEFLGSLGAERFVDCDDAATLDGLAPFDVVFDAVEKLPRSRALSWVRRGGTFLTVHPVLEKFMPDWLAWSRGGKHVRSVFVKPDGAGLAELREWMNAGRLRTSVQATYDLGNAAQAQQDLAEGQVRGKLVLAVSEG